jgi:hypothetical protein
VSIGRRDGFAAKTFYVDKPDEIYYEHRQTRDAKPSYIFYLNIKAKGKDYQVTNQNASSPEKKTADFLLKCAKTLGPK